MIDRNEGQGGRDEGGRSAHDAELRAGRTAWSIVPQWHSLLSSPSPLSPPVHAR